jgi:hypothetical protein
VSELRANITATNAAIITANVGMKTYVDTGLASALIAASSYGNSVVAAYLPVDSTITDIQANVTAANLNIASTQTNVTAANASISATQANVTAANLNITALQANITASNVNISTLQTVSQYLSSNVNGSIFSRSTYTGNVYTANTYTVSAEVTGNLTVGNINASGNLVMTGTDSTTIRFVRSVDTTVTSGEIYGNIDFAGEDTGGSGVRARLSVQADRTVGQTRVHVYTPPNSGPSFTLYNNGYYGAQAGFIGQQVPQIDSETQFNNFGPTSNDSSSSYISSLNTSFVNKVYGVNNFGFSESEAAQEFIHAYAGFAGGDRANIALNSYVSGYGSTPLLWSSFSPLSNVDLEISVQGVYTADTSASPPIQKRLRKRWLASIIYFSANSNYIISDQQLQDPVYNSDVTNWPAGAAATGKVFLQANATVGSQALYLRLDSPTGAAVTSQVKWRWVCKFRSA